MSNSNPVVLIDSLETIILIGVAVVGAAAAGAVAMAGSLIIRYRRDLLDRAVRRCRCLKGRV